MEERYNSQIILNQIGGEGQKKLARSSAIVIGTGGLGSSVLTYLVAAGVGRVGLVDFDTVAPSNLNRQFLHGESDVGRHKAISAKESLAALNKDVEVIAYDDRLTDKNAASLLSGYDLALGAVDTYDVRFVINRAAAALNLPYIDGGVNGFFGCIMFSNPPATPCLNCVYPHRSEHKGPIGILGATAGVIGSIQANQAILWMLGAHNSIENKLLMYDALNMSIRLIDINRDAKCTVCGKMPAGATDGGKT